MSEQWIFLDGEFVTKENAKVSVFDHGFCTETGFLKDPDLQRQHFQM